MKPMFTALVTLVILTACASKEEPPHHGGSDAGSRDAGADAAMADASLEADADAGLDAGSWDGRELPPLEWDLPDCATERGILARQIYDDQTPSDPSRLSLDGLTAGGGRILIQSGSQTAEVSADLALPVVSPDGYHSWILHAGQLAIAEERLRAFAFMIPNDDRDHSDNFSAIVALDPERPARVLERSQWTFYPESILSELDAAGNWHFLGTPRGGDFEPGIHDMLVDPELNVTRSTLIASTASGWRAGLEGKYVELARSDAGSMLLHQDHRERPDTLSLVPYDETGARPTVRWEDPLLSQGFDTIARFDAAADGDVVALQYSLVHYHGAYIERYGEVALDTGAVLRGPEPFGETGAFWDLELLTAPGGGVDVVQLAASVADNPRELANRGKPLHVYLGLPRPLRLENHTPLRVGAGAFAVHFLARRDGDRLVIAWRERGPEAGNRTAQGIYWAVLQCDP